jgi:peroxidase
LHTLFLREHNRIANSLQQINTHWSDETLYQESKRILNAEWQHIVYNEWLPLVLGDRFMTRYGLYPIDKGYSRQYRTDFDPRITNAFASAAFRFGHSLIPGDIRYVIQGLKEYKKM